MEHPNSDARDNQECNVESGNIVPIAPTHNAITEVSEDIQAVTIVKYLNEVYGDCASCGKKFLVRCAADDVRCDECYQADMWLNEESDWSDYDPDIHGTPDEISFHRVWCSGCNCPHYACACLPF